MSVVCVAVCDGRIGLVLNGEGLQDGLDDRGVAGPAVHVAKRGMQARLKALQAAIHREAEGAEADPFDEAMVAAVAGLAEALKAEADALAELEARAVKVGRRA